MTVLLYIITFAIVIGIALLNICIGRYFHQKMQTLEFDKMQLKIFDIVSAILGVLSAILLLPFLFWAKIKQEQNRKKWHNCMKYQNNK